MVADGGAGIHPYNSRMTTTQRTVLFLGFFAGALAGAYPPRTETRTALQEEDWLELRPVPVSTAWQHAPVWAPPQMGFEDDLGYTFRLTYQVDLPRLLVVWGALACITGAVFVLVPARQREEPRG
jgi:hypothetical protein